MRSWAKQIYKRMGYRVVAASLIFLIGAIIYAFLYTTVNGDTYKVELFQLSEETIRSAKTVEDPVKTELERQRAAAELGPSYQFSAENADNQAALIKSIFGYIADVKEIPENEETLKPQAINKMIEEVRENISLLDTNESTLRLTDEMLRALLLLPNENLVKMEQELTDIVKSALSEPLRAEDVTGVQNEVEQQIRESTEIPASALQAAFMIGRFGIVPNEVIDEELTEAQADSARASVEPTRILQGQVLVQEGQMIDREVYRQLELAGMTQEKEDFKPLAGLLLFVVITMGILIILTIRSKSSKQQKLIKFSVILAVVLISLTLMQLLSLVSDNFDVAIAFLFPTALAGMLVRMLLNERVAVYVTLLIGAVGGMMLQGENASTLQMDIALYIIFGGLAGVYLIAQQDRRSHLLQTSLAAAVVNAFFIGFYLLVGQSQYDWTEIGFYFAAAIVSGLLSGAMTIGLLPFFESIFGLLSTMRLIELSNPNHPLLKKILTETPGTYHHSVMVANLADASCEAIGANGLLARVGCYYHDIGKTNRPQYFIENQVSIKNPHDSLPPEKSRDIILAHGSQGADLLRKHKMPKEIIDVAEQHHGTSLLKFFYFKAKEKDPDVREADYRYAGPKPQTKEIAIISVADSIEAAVRSMKEPTSEKIKKLVDAIVEDKLRDGQFDECDLTMKELKKVKHVMCETLNGIFHSRIEYPQDPK